MSCYRVSYASHPIKSTCSQPADRVKSTTYLLPVLLNDVATHELLGEEDSSSQREYQTQSIDSSLQSLRNSTFSIRRTGTFNDSEESWPCDSHPEDNTSDDNCERTVSPPTPLDECWVLLDDDFFEAQAFLSDVRQEATHHSAQQQQQSCQTLSANDSHTHVVQHQDSTQWKTQFSVDDLQEYTGSTQFDAEKGPSYEEFKEDPAHNFWTWDIGKQQWFHRDDMTGAMIWCPTELD